MMVLPRSVRASCDSTKQLGPDVRQVGLIGDVHAVVQCVSAHDAPIGAGQHQAARAAGATQSRKTPQSAVVIESVQLKMLLLLRSHTAR